VSRARAVVLRLHPPHLAPADARGLPHQTSHDGCLCAGASHVLARCGKRGDFQRATPGGGPLGQVSNKAAGSGGTLTLRLLLFVTYSRRCKTSSVGQSAGLSVLRSSVRSLQKLKKLRTQIYMDLRYVDPLARVLNYCFKS